MLSRLLALPVSLLLVTGSGLAAEPDAYYTDPGWKPRAVLPAKDALKGDFWPASPKAGVDYNAPGFADARLSPPPPPGVHPRVLVTPEDVELIRARVAEGDKAPAAFQVMWERVKRNRSAFYALVANDDELGRQLAAELFKKVEAMEPKLDKLDKQADRDNLWAAERSIVASGDPEPPQIWALLDYDYLHRWMTPEQRAATERVIARLTKGRITNFMTYPDHFLINNHQGFGMEYMRLLLLIEGQPGFDDAVYKLGEAKARAMLDWYLNADGMCFESIKGWLNVSVFVALARRDRDLLKHSHLRAKMRFFQNAIHWQDGRWQIRDEMRASAFHVIWTMRYFYPDDPVLKWLYAATFSSHDFLTDANAKWPNPVGISDELLLLFAQDVPRDAAGKPIDWTEQARIDELKLPLTWKDDQRGYLITRNSWNKDDLQLGFTTKQDFFYGGHEGSENNRIVLWADGVNWVRDSNMLAVKATFLQNMLTVDGKGLAWPPAPGVWLGVQETPAGVAAAGDGKIGYSFSKVMQVHPLDFPSAKLPYYAPFAEGNFDLTRDQQIAFHPGTVKWNDGYAHTDYGPWSGETRLVESYRENNPMEQAFRTVYLARGKHPYVLVFDDARKDGDPHLYDWNITIPGGIDLLDAKTVEVAFQNVPPTDRRDGDLLLGKAETPRDPKTNQAKPKAGDPLFLVRTLWRNSPYGFPVPRFEKLNVEPQAPYGGLGHVTIPAISTEPEFRVLLYPHRQGDPIPQTSWNDDRTELTVKIADVTDVYRFGKTDAGRTVFSVQRNDEPVFRSEAPPARPILHVRDVRFDANDLRTTRLEGTVPVYKFADAVEVRLERPAAPAFITYTLDGSEPTKDSPRYEAPLRLDRSAKLAARTFDPAWTAGPPQSEVLRADFEAVPPAKGLAEPPKGSRPGLLARVYEKKTVLWNERGFFDAAKIMLPDLDRETPTVATLVEGFRLPYVNPARPVTEQAKGFYRFDGWFHATQRGVHTFLVDSCGPVRLRVGGQTAIASTGVFHQQQAERRGDVVLDAGWHPVELIVTDPLLWNLPTTGEMPFRVALGFDGGALAPVPADALRAVPPAGLALVKEPEPASRKAVKPPVWSEPGFHLSLFDREGRNRDADYLDIDGQKPLTTLPASRLEPNVRPAVVRVYDGWFFAPMDGEYEFRLAARKAESAGLGELRSAFQNQLRVDDEIVVQRGVAGRRPLGHIDLEKGWHRISFRLGASSAEGSVTYPDGETRPLAEVDFQRESRLVIHPRDEAAGGSVQEIFRPTEIVIALPPDRSGTIRYTLDGSKPGPTSPVYEAPIKLDRSAVVTATAFLPDGTPAANGQVDFRLVAVPELGLVAKVGFADWDGKTGATKLDDLSGVWIAPGSVAGKAPFGPTLTVNGGAAGDGGKLKSTVDVNVARPVPAAGLKVTGLRMRENAITVGVLFRSHAGAGKIFGKDGYSAFGKAYRTVSSTLQGARVSAMPGRLSGDGFRPEEWNQVVLTADGKSSQLYLNGKLIAEGDGSMTLVTDALDFFTDHPADVGEIRIYGRVLPAKDIAQWHETLRAKLAP